MIGSGGQIKDDFKNSTLKESLNNYQLISKSS
jgi:hypothetical protein